MDATVINRYWEVSVDILGTAGNMYLGIANSTHDIKQAPGRDYIGTINSYGLTQTGIVFADQVQTSGYMTYVQGDILTFAIKNGNLYVGTVAKGWFNGSNPNTNTGAILTGLTGNWGPSIGQDGTTAKQITCNFGASPWSGTIPTGSVGWRI